MRRLRAADEALDRVRLYLRLAARWEWLSAGQYHHAAEMVAEIGRLLGGWIKANAERILAKRYLWTCAGMCPNGRPRAAGRRLQQ